MKLTKYYLAAFIAFLIWGFFSLALKPLHEYPSLDILFYRVFFSSFLMVLINVLFRKKVLRQNWDNFQKMNSQQKKSAVALTFGGALFLASNWFVFIFVMNHVSVKAASLAYLICPILTTVFAFFILKEKLSKAQWMAVGISVVGCTMLSFDHFQDIFYSLIVATTYALYLVSQRKNTAIDKFVALTIQLLFTSLLMLPFFPKYSGEVPTASLFYSCLLVIVVVFTIIPLFLNLYALKGINSATVGIMMYINPIINFVLALFYYNEVVSSIQFASYLLILISILVFNEKILFSGRKRKSLSAIEKSE